jgi:hypothetical protein
MTKCITQVVTTIFIVIVLAEILSCGTATKILGSERIKMQIQWDNENNDVNWQEMANKLQKTTTNKRTNKQTRQREGNKIQGIKIQRNKLPCCDYM